MKSQNTFITDTIRVCCNSSIFYSKRDRLSLETYYEKHWQKMINPNPPSQKGDLISSVELAVLNILVQQEQNISVKAIAEIIDEDEYEVETVLDNWLEFLEQENIREENRYRFYHACFRNWLFKRNPLP